MDEKIRIFNTTEFNDFRAMCDIDSLKFKSYKEKHHFDKHERIILNREYIKNIGVDI